MKKKILIPVFLAALALPLALQQSSDDALAEFIGETTDRAAYIQIGTAVNNQMAEEGFVLLKNDGFLPMQPGKASLAGRSSFSIARGGAGSGASSPSSGVDAYDIEKSLTEVGFTVNPTLKAFYADSSKSGIGRTNGNDGWKGNSQVQIGETPRSCYSQTELDSLKQYNDVAIQVITREGSEGCDVKMIDARDFDPRANGTNVSATPLDDITKKHALELSDNEADLLALLEENFDHVIIIINSSNIFECDVFENDPKVSGVLWIGNPGDVGPAAIGKILTGAVNPSGRTVDTWARDFREDPTFQNFSDNAGTNEDIIKLNDSSYYGKTPTYAPQDTMFNADGTPTRSYGTLKGYNDTSNPRWLDAGTKVMQGGINGVKPSAYVSYEEGIYLDYRYYETYYADLAKEDAAAADAWYDGQKGVVYPFGYGLSYTEFDQKIVRAKIDTDKGIGEVTVKVTNIGEVAGKDAVQLYWKAPYFTGEIEKADHVLCAFDKTDNLDQGESQYIHLSFYLQDVANYDFLDSNNNGFAGYELDAGDYAVMLMKNAHESYGEATFKLKAKQYPTDRFTGEEVKNRFTDRGFYNSMPEGDLEFTQFSRADFDGTFPTHPTVEDRTLSVDSRFEEFLTHQFSIAELDEGNFEYVPEAAYHTEDEFVENNWEQAASTLAKDNRTQLIDMKNVAWEDDDAWNAFLNQFTWAEMLNYVENNRMSSPANNNIGKSGFSEGDGPQKFSIMQWVSSPIIAATFNPKLAHKQGECVGMESRISGKSGWWGPGVNTHRSPFGGRNFEYYAADPFLMGRMAAEVVGTATQRGVYAYFKHFTVNDQEKNRESGISFVSEQAFREIYLKSFQMVFEEGKSIGVMSSYNRIGLMETAASYPLLTEVLRGEWGFKGAVLSDMTHSGNGSVDFKCYENVNNRVLAGCNSQLDSGGFSGASEAKWDSSAFNGKGAPVYTNKNGEKVISFSYWYAVRQMIKGIMYMSVRCTAGNPNNSNFVLASGEDIVNEYKINEEFNIDVNEFLPEGQEGATFKVNDRIVLPEDVSFDSESGVISGKIGFVGLFRIDIIGYGPSQTFALKFVINIVPDAKAIDDNGVKTAEVVGDGNYKKGCFGDIASTGALIALIALAGLGIALLSFRKKEQ